MLSIAETEVESLVFYILLLPLYNLYFIIALFHNTHFILIDHPSLQRNIEQTVIPAYQPPPPEIAKMFAEKQAPASPSVSLSSSNSSVPPPPSTPTPTPAPASSSPTSASTPTAPIPAGSESKAESGKGKRGEKEGEDGERRRRSKGDEDDDSDFEAEIDHYLINNDLDPITPQTPRAASRSGWVNTIY